MKAAPGAPVSHLLYLHGFRSSPRSTKARRVADWVSRHRPDLIWACPQLPPSPGDAIRQLETLVAGWPRERIAVVGSSLGGFYATVLAERLDCRAVVLNPAVDPGRDLATHIGVLKAWHSDESFSFRAEYIDELHAMRPARLARPERYLAVIAKGDEVLSWHEMRARYDGCAMRLIEGGDHALTDFDAGLSDLVAFLGLQDDASA